LISYLSPSLGGYKIQHYNSWIKRNAESGLTMSTRFFY